MSASRRDRLKPVEYLGFAAACAIFTGLVVLMATRDPILALIFFGIAFIVTLVGISTAKLAIKSPKTDDVDGDGPSA